MDESLSEESCGGGGDYLENEDQKKRHLSGSSSSKDVRKAVEDTLSTPSNSLDLSRKKLQHLTEEIYKLPNLKHLHLEGNALAIIPKDLFQQLPNLVWLDLRYNKIKTLPPGIGCHKQLKTLLLERNPIKRLPVELEMPPVEKLNLTELMKSSLDLSDEWPNEEEMLRFQKLREEMVKDEKEEFLANQDLNPKATMQEFAEFRKNGRKKERLYNKSATLSRKKFSQKNIFSEFQSYGKMIQAKRAEEFRLAVQKELKETQALIEQHRKDKEMLREWRQRAKMMKEKKEVLFRYSPTRADMKVEELQQERLRKTHPTICTYRPVVSRLLWKWETQVPALNQISKSAPYATDSINYHNTREGCENLKKRIPEKSEHVRRMLKVNSIREAEVASASKEKELEQRIKQHTQMMKERRKKSKGTSQEEMQRAKQDFETAEKLQAELAQVKQELQQEYRFTAFTGEPVPDSPRMPPHNIFSTMKF
ncbi:leucine-rich repeat-containing protein 27 isoform X3 [Gopherus evgoodei]|uniref:leucine-rich repeat-containing protein 27 isoform X3 n=1 Tax=Gopherus evgoodei TaxID=1825980 RepID=UPI0011CFE803|nr:leucine-rich repeat-containing protein 27 isoform X3 [Gopherus evgoodei]